MGRKKSQINQKLSILSAVMLDEGKRETSRIIEEIRRDLDGIWEISDIIAKAKEGKALLGCYEFDRKIGELAEMLYIKLYDDEKFDDLSEDEQEVYRQIVRDLLSALE